MKPAWKYTSLDQVEDFRVASGLSKSSLARMLDISRPGLMLWYKGSVPTEDRQRKIATLIRKNGKKVLAKKSAKNDCLPAVSQKPKAGDDAASVTTMKILCSYLESNPRINLTPDELVDLVSRIKQELS